MSFAEFFASVPVQSFLALPITIQLVVVYLLLMNVTTVVVFFIDKQRSQSRHAVSRISENTLLLLTLLGGSVGALYAMKHFRHKTKKLSFQAKFGVIIAAQVILLFYLLSQYTTFSL